MKMLIWFQRHKTVLFRVVAYLTTGVILLTVFLYLTFPWQKLSRYVRIQAERYTASSIKVEKSEVRFPFKMIWKGIVFSPYSAENPIEVKADQLDLEWTIGSLLRKRLELLWSLRTAGGEGQGEIAGQPTDRGMQYHFEGDLKELNLGRIIEFVAPNIHKIEGTVDLTGVQHDWIGSDFLKGSGAADLEVVDARIGALDLVFSQIRGRLTMKAGVAHLVDVTAHGPSMELMGSGNILFRSDLSGSLININSRVTVKDTAGPLSMLGGLSASGKSGKAIELSLRGTLRRPTLFLDGTPVLTLTTL
jgi:type II secretion system protein N